MDGIVSHGDDLPYLFDVHDIHGKSLESNTPINEEDERVRNIFTQMIADFARHGKLRLDNHEVSPFSSLTNNFIQVKPKPVFANQFRFCEMALWCGITERLKSDACKFLKYIDTEIKHVQKQITDVNKQIHNVSSQIIKDPSKLLTKMDHDLKQKIKLFN